MWTRHLRWSLPVLVIVALAGFGIWLLTLPAGTQAVEAPQVPEAEMQAILASLRPPEGRRPVIAVIGINDATETTDYLMPAGILRRANVADVTMLATGPGPVELYRRFGSSRTRRWRSSTPSIRTAPTMSSCPP